MTNADVDAFTITYDALLRPARFAAFLDGGWHNIRRASLAVLLWLGAALACIGLMLPQLFPIDTQSRVASLGIAPALALMISSFGIMIGDGMGRSTLAHMSFWLLRCQVAITPPLALFLTLASSSALIAVQRMTLILFVLLPLLGVWLGGGLTVVLALRKNQHEASATRWVVAAGSLMIGTALWLSPPLRMSAALLFIPFCAGLTVGLLRPISYLWEMLWSFALALAVRLGANPLRVLPLHPVNYDDLGLLPLPGLSNLLIRACIADIDAGSEWLLRIARHPGQRRAAERAIIGIVRQGLFAHPLLFWLSTSEEGPALLTGIAERARGRHALIGAYATFAAVADPEAWLAVLQLYRETLAQAVDLPGGQAIFSLLDASLGTLQADRWPAAITHLGSTSAPAGVILDPIWLALATIQSWASGTALSDITDRADAVFSLVGEIEDLEGWPITLIAALCEHLLFLIGIERRRGAWLV